MWFFTPDHRQSQRLYLAGLLGEVAHPTPDIDAVPPWRRASKTQAPLSSHALSHTVCPSPRIFMSRSLFLSPGQRSSRFPFWGLLMGSRGGKTPRELLPRLTQNFSLLALPPCPYPDRRLHNTIRLFCSRVPSIVRWPPHLHWSTWPWPVYCSMGENATGEVCTFSSVTSCLYRSIKWIKA